MTHISKHCVTNNVTFLPFSNSLTVMFPVPGPISRITSVGLRAACNNRYCEMWYFTIYTKMWNLIFTTYTKMWNVIFTIYTKMTFHLQLCGGYHHRSLLHVFELPSNRIISPQYSTNMNHIFENISERSDENIMANISKKLSGDIWQILQIKYKRQSEKTI